MRQTNLFRWFLMVFLMVSLWAPALRARATGPFARAAPLAEVTAYDLILAMNTLRVSRGLPALVEDPIINAVAQSTAQIMAASQMSWHIGDVSGRLAAAGYGGGAKVWATENFAVGNQSIDEIMIIWSDASHMIPAVNPAYCHVGAGTAKSANGRTYFVLQAAYIAGQACGPYSPAPGTNPGGGSSGGSPGIVPGIIVPVKVATPDADGNVYHEVAAGQSFWAIAVAYKVTIKDLEFWNNISKDTRLQIGQRLLIPGENTQGYATPTPVGMVQVSTRGADGKIVHEVQPYHTLYTISEAYGIQMETILAQNGLQADWPLQIGQKLVISLGNVTPSPTPRPLTPLQMLTPESDGKYYHTVKSGETLFWIAGLYEVGLGELMAWNGMNETSILYPDQKLVLLVTPPVTPTYTPAPVTSTPVPSTATPLPTSTMAASPAALTTGQMPTPEAAPVGLWLALGALAGGMFLVALIFKRNR